jgi:hypothetical protein
MAALRGNFEALDFGQVKTSIAAWKKRGPASLVGSRSTITTGLIAESKIALHIRPSWVFELT